MVDRNKGKRQARAALKYQRDKAERQQQRQLGQPATVDSVVGNRVVLVGGGEELAYSTSQLVPGDEGIVTPVEGGGFLFTKTGADQVVEAALEDKRSKSDTIPQTEVESSQGHQDLAEDISAQLVEIANKRDQSVPVPQTDVGSSTGKQDLAEDISGVLTDLLDKRDKGVNIPQGDVTGLPGDLTDIRTTAMQSIRIEVDDSSSSTFSATIGSIPNALLFAADPYTTYQLLCHIDTKGSETDGNFNGARFGVAIPSGATIQGSVVSRVSGISDRYLSRWSTDGLNPVFFSSGDTSNFDVEIRATITVGANDGYIWPVMAVADASDTITVLAESNARLQVVE